MRVRSFSFENFLLWNNTVELRRQKERKRKNNDWTTLSSVVAVIILTDEPRKARAMVRRCVGEQPIQPDAAEEEEEKKKKIGEKTGWDSFCLSSAEE
jgi:hypothetical protein